MGNYTNQDCLNEIQKVSTAKLSIKTAIESKGVTVPADTTFAGYAELIENIPQAKPEETLTQTITENGSHVFNPSEGHVFNSASITVDVPQGITPTGTINISDNGTYDVTDKATAVVAVGGKDYRYKNGTPDVAGLTAIGWTADDIGYYGANTPHYAWENDNYKVSQENIDLYSLDDPQPSLYKDNPNVTFVPNKNMSTYFKGLSGYEGAFSGMKYIKSIPLYDTSNMKNMCRMFHNCSSLQTIPLLDTSSIETTVIQTYMNGFEGMFENCSSLQTIPLLDTSMSPNFGSMFRGCTSLTSIPQLNTSNASSMSHMFENCSSLQTIPQLNTSKVKNIDGLFIGCSKLTSIPQLDTSNVTRMYEMFKNCSSLQTIPLLDTSKVTNMEYMFENCSSLQTIPLLDTSKVTNMHFIFHNCTSLTSVSFTDTSKVTNMGYMFSSCSALTSVSFTDTSSVTEMDRMFENCSALTSVSFTDTSKVKSMSYMFYNCSSLQSVEGIDFSSQTSAPYTFFGYSTVNSLTHFIVKGSINFTWNSYGLRNVPNIDYDSIKSILEAMNRTTNTNAKTMEFNSVIVDREGELAGLVASCATKGWTVTGLTIKEQSMINSITPNIEHITKSNFTRDSSNKLSLTINANEDWVVKGRPQDHGSSSLGIDFDYYDATTNEKLREGFHGSGSTFTPTSGGVGETVIEADVPSGYSYQPDPQPGEYALVGISFRTKSSPYEYVDYYFKVYPDGE